MDQYWKQSVGSGTASEHKLFLKARIKLTALYVLIVAIIVFGFSIFLYQSIQKNLRDASDDDFADVQSHHHFVQNALPPVENDLILADIYILIITAGFSFVLAGKTLEPIQESIEAQKAFAANASHELRTPLAVMRNDIEVYKRNNSPTKELTESIMESNLEEISHMSTIVEDLLLLARSDNRIGIDAIEIDLNALIKSVITRMHSVAEAKKINLTYSSSESFIIKGSQKSLERVVLNILQNAIDHTPTGGTVTIETKKNVSKHVEILITDTGSGIAKEKLPHIFKRFYKGDSLNGTGLGLSIVKGILDQHDGEIAVRSEIGKGTTVVITFPVS